MLNAGICRAEIRICQAHDMMMTSALQLLSKSILPLELGLITLYIHLTISATPINIIGKRHNGN